MSSVLDEICEKKREHVAQRKRQTVLSGLEAQAKEGLPTRPFLGALEDAVAKGGIGLIAEIKKASPSKGLI
ncbi:MAG: indole-3-glycerol-phosphate synthase TrpC, partial [Alphaproteobacteria bacterium]|nr:indole-3-glycerol-phosphate synthase TrpC [Alphaproteobacteria bacterium]